MTGSQAVYQWGVRLTVQVCSLWAVILGAGLIWGGPERFSAPSFAVARAVPGGCYMWGGLMAAFGLISLAGIVTGWRRRTVMAGTAAQGLWYLFFAVALFRSFLEDPKVATTGWTIYSLLAVVHFVLYVVGHQLAGLRR